MAGIFSEIESKIRGTVVLCRCYSLAPETTVPSGYGINSNFQIRFIPSGFIYTLRRRKEPGTVYWSLTRSKSMIVAVIALGYGT
ncbi:hypothetical protein [Acetobacterium tundrae]|uniref:Uncharacterized protein n=1 Tax=Acetobacterium tundrae TaxID=132932 RepID=A0ABR6WIC4_9FIRM|nr:hypothetical protein [Acetobacterium tundrae]MBC3796230.1 hypothetical protein [Acetobacterium tundrae]